ncbi:MAG: aminoacyl-tRNA hydrolase [Candidatus Hydrogenedentota bacterium]
MPGLLVVGLGNPGRAYAGTYHNAGREVVERFAEKNGIAWSETSKAFVASFDKGWLILPNTYMNCSGEAVGPLSRRKGIPPEQVLVVVDDLYIPAGSVRIRSEGGAAGHNGLKSIEEALGTTAYPRIRIGIGPDPGGEARTQYVLSRPRPETMADLFEGKEAALAALEAVLTHGVSEAQKMFHGG